MISAITLDRVCNQRLIMTRTTCRLSFPNSLSRIPIPLLSKSKYPETEWERV